MTSTSDKAEMICKLKKKCPNKSDDLFYCWSADCSGWMHANCCKLLFDRHNVPQTDRPSEQETNEDGQPIVFCTLKCHKKWKSSKARQKREEAAALREQAKKDKRPRVPWEDDGSIDVLMDWLTTQGNYEKCCGGNKSVLSKSKKQHQKMISELIKEKKPETSRSTKDVENKINTLEKSFREAHDWANNTGVGVPDGDFQAHVLKKCPHCDQLEPIVLELPNSKPLYANEDEDKDPLGLEDSDSSSLEGMPINNNDEDSESSDEGGAEAVNEINNPASNKTPNEDSPSDTASSTRKRLSASDPQTRKKVQKKKGGRGGKGVNEADGVIHSPLGDGAMNRNHLNLFLNTAMQTS